nr:ribonuclease H-like domain-containing protein [Tanacetum cinerariifolium]
MLGVKYGNGWVIPIGGSVSDGVTAADAFWSTAGGSPCTWTFTAASSVYDRGLTAARGFFPWIRSPAIETWIQLVTGFIPVTNSGHSVLSTPFRPLHLNNVLITHNIVKKLISVRQFVRDNSCTVTRRVLLRCDSTGDLYPVTKPSTIHHAFLTNKLPVLCHACQFCKDVKLLFVSSSSSVTLCFDIVHSDLWTSPIPSLSGFQYYVLFLDHYSQYVWVYPLINKSDVLSKFMLFRNYGRTQFKCEIKTFQCDHGSEFDNHAFHKLFHDNDIQFRFSCPRTSQQNGKSERMICTINNLILTLLFQAHLPPNYWTEAFNMAVYLLNILPSCVINNEIPFTRLFGAQPDYSVLRVFGCLCYPHIDTNHKLRPRTTPSIFLRHAANHFGYRCLDLNTNKIIISRHVTFDETLFSFPSTKSITTHSYDFLDDSTDLISIIIRTAPITPVSAPVHTPQVDVPTPPTPPIPPPPPTPQSVPQIIPEHTPAPTNDSPTVSIHPMVTRSRVGTTRPNPCYAGYVSTISPLPRSYKEAFNDPNWRNAMFDEYNALIKNKTWTSVPRPEGANIVHCIWLFCHKFLADGTLSRYKHVLLPMVARRWRVLMLMRFLNLAPGFNGLLLTLLWLDLLLVVVTPLYLFTNRRKYAMEILERAHMVGCNLSQTPADTESKLGDGAHDPREPHFSALKRILRNLLSWSSKRQPTLSRSNAKAKYRGVANAVAETCWIRNLLRELHTPLSSATIVYCDNTHMVHIITSSYLIQYQHHFSFFILLITMWVEVTVHNH